MVPDGEKTEVTAPVERTGNEGATAEVQQPAAPEKAENGNLASAQTSGKGGVQARVSSYRGLDKPLGTTIAQNTTKIMINANIGMMGRNPHDDNSYG